MGAAERFLKVDPRVLPERPPTPPDVTVHSGTEVGARPFYDVDDEASRDEPSDVGYSGLPYEEWLTMVWDTVDKDISLVAFVDGQPAAVTLLTVNPETGRAMSNGSSTLRQFRGRGLIKLIKWESLTKAAASGVTMAITGNDRTNAPMLAVNTWLGYTDLAGSRAMLKTL
jgi:hypothetical protein